MDAAEEEKSNENQPNIKVPSIIGGFCLWLFSLNVDGGILIYLSYYSSVFFFIAIPVMIIISYCFIILFIVPMALVLEHFKIFTPATLTLFGTISGLLALILYPDTISFSEKINDGWWGMFWMGLMALIYSLTFTSDQTNSHKET